MPNIFCIIIIISIEPMIGMITDGDGGLVIPSVFGGISLVAKWVNFLLGLIGTFAVIAIIYAGIRLIVNFGDEEATTQAKNISVSDLQTNYGNLIFWNTNSSTYAKNGFWYDTEKTSAEQSLLEKFYSGMSYLLRY